MLPSSMCYCLKTVALHLPDSAARVKWSLYVSNWHQQCGMVRATEAETVAHLSACGVALQWLHDANAWKVPLSALETPNGDAVLSRTHPPCSSYLQAVSNSCALGAES